MIYLASPYSHPDPVVREQRYVEACRATAILMRHKLVVFSPIVYSAHLAENWGVGNLHETWYPIDDWVLSRADWMLVLQLDGWIESVGIRHEVEVARQQGVPIDWVAPGEALKTYARYETGQAEPKT